MDESFTDLSAKPAQSCGWSFASGRVVAFEEFPDTMLTFSPFVWGMAWCGEDNAAWLVRVDRYFKRAELVRLDFVRGTGGGAASARARFDHGDVFKVGVSVCGNHDSALNISVWSDKYRGPADPRRWEGQATAAAAHKLQGRLLLISGDMDENVHVGHTFALADALIRANRHFDLLIVPNEGHLVLMTSGYAQRRTWDYFVQHLLDEKPAEDFELKFEPEALARMARNWLREMQ